jgi:hypothetical protein
MSLTDVTSIVLGFHADPNAPPWLVAAVFGITFVLFGIQAWRFHRFVNQLLAQHEFENPSLGEVRAMVDAIDRENPGYSFGAQRLANITFRGQQISIVCGPIAWSDAITHSYKCIYAIADAEQSDWMRRNSDVFETAFSGSEFSVFWVDVPHLLRQLKRK